jgi:hypothetical protein
MSKILQAHIENLDNGKETILTVAIETDATHFKAYSKKVNIHETVYTYSILQYVAGSGTKVSATDAKKLFTNLSRKYNYEG